MPVLRQANVLRHRDFRLLFIGQAASNFGSNAVGVAMAIYVTRSTHSPTDLGLILAAQTVPFVVLLLFGGVWADRLPRHRVMVVTDLIRGSLHAVLAVLILIGSARVWEIAAIEFMFGAAWAFFQPAYTGLLPQTVPEDQIKTARVLIEASWNVSLVLGPSVATALVLTVGAGEAFAADAATFLISASTLLPIRPRSRGDELAEIQESILGALRAGFREVSSRPWVWVTISAFCVTLMCSYATWMSLGPTVVGDVYGHVGLFGVLVALYGIGSVCGSVLASVWHPQRPLRGALRTAALWPGMSVVLALGPPRVVVYAFVLLAGIESGLFLIFWETSLARHIPPHALSRVSSYDWMGSLALLPVGLALAGPLAGELGARDVLGVGGAIGVVALLLALLPRSTRELSAEAEPGSSAALEPQPRISRASSA
jgi:MFS family permease